MRRYERVPEDELDGTERTDGSRPARSWWCPICPTCRAERGRDVVRLVIVGSDARRVCWRCQTVLEHESIPF